MGCEEIGAWREDMTSIESIVEHLKSSITRWANEPKPFGDLFDITHKGNNIFLYWNDAWTNHDSIFPVSLIVSAIKHVNEVAPKKVASGDCDVYTFDDEHRRGLYLCISVKA